MKRKLVIIIKEAAEKNSGKYDKSMVTLDLRKMGESFVNTKNDKTENAELNNSFNKKRDTKRKIVLEIREYIRKQKA